MPKVTLYRDKRDGVICLRFNHNSTHAERRLTIIVEEKQWDGNRIINHPQREVLNISLEAILSRARARLLTIIETQPTRNMKASILRDIVCQYVLNEESAKESFFDVFERFIEDGEVKRTGDKKKASTRTIYTTTLNKVRQYDSAASFESIDAKWLREFRMSMVEQGFSKNYISIQLRNIRSVFNYAIDEHIISADVYPFRKFAIVQESKQARDLTRDELRRIFATRFDDRLQRYADIFKLQFCLIGINLADLYNLTVDNYKHGRIFYKRMKTGKEYNIKVEPEAAAIINAHKRTDGRLLNFFDNCTSNSVNGFMKQYNKALRSIARQLHIRQHMTSYVSRYSWTTILTEDLEISREVASRCLGHSFGSKTTAGYSHIKDTKIVDNANRKVLDYVFND